MCSILIIMIEIEACICRSLCADIKVNIFY